MLTASVCADLLLNRVFAYFGFPRQIVSDRDPRFTSEWWRTVCHMCGVRHAYTTAYHPQANGAVERTNRRILDSLRRLLVSSPNLSWVELLPCVLFLLNDAQGVTSLSPNEAVFGRPLFFLTDDVSEPGPRSVPSAEQWVGKRLSLQGQISGAISTVSEKSAAPSSLLSDSLSPSQSQTNIQAVSDRSFQSVRPNRFSNRSATPNRGRSNSNSNSNLTLNSNSTHPTRFQQHAPTPPRARQQHASPNTECFYCHAKGHFLPVCLLSALLFPLFFHLHPVDIFSSISKAENG